MELVLVDNGSTDETKQVVQDFAQRAPFPVHYVFEARPGLGGARNAGLRHALGDILAFTDDDCIVAPDWIKRVTDSFADRSQLKIMGGRVELYNSNDAPLTIKTSMEPCEFRGNADVTSFVLGCNFAVDRRVFDRIGLFDCRFGAGTALIGGEDIDLVYRAVRGGVRVFYDPGQLVYHNHGRSGQQAAAQAKRYSISVGSMIAKHVFGGDPALLRIPYWDLSNAIFLRRGRARVETVKSFGYRLRGFGRYVRYGLGRSRT